MGSAATSAHTPSPDVAALDVIRSNQQSATREVDVDDVRSLLKELRLRRQQRLKD